MTAHELARLLLAGPDNVVGIARESFDDYVWGFSEIQTAKWRNDEQIGQYYNAVVLVQSEEFLNDIKLEYGPTTTFLKLDLSFDEDEPVITKIEALDLETLLRLELKEFLNDDDLIPNHGMKRSDCLKIENDSILWSIDGEQHTLAIYGPDNDDTRAKLHQKWSQYVLDSVEE